MTEPIFTPVGRKAVVRHDGDVIDRVNAAAQNLEALS
jgi:hypothetical protein